MLSIESNSSREEPSVESLAAGWQELARQLRFLALSGTPVHPEDVKRFHTLVSRGSEAIRALALGLPDATLGLRTVASERAVAMRMLQSGAPATDSTSPADGVERAPSRTHILALAGSETVLPAQDIVLLLAARKQVGVLKLRTERETFTLELDHGRVAHLHTSMAAEGERLGEILVRRGILNALQIENIRKRNRRGRIGEILLAGNFVTQAQLLGALEAQIHLLVGRLCQARAKQFSYWRGPLVFAQPRLCIDAEALLLAPFCGEPQEPPLDQRGAG
jgi:hypothetical protein